MWKPETRSRRSSQRRPHSKKRSQRGRRALSERRCPKPSQARVTTYTKASENVILFVFTIISIYNFYTKLEKQLFAIIPKINKASEHLNSSLIPPHSPKYRQQNISINKGYLTKIFRRRLMVSTEGLSSLSSQADTTGHSSSSPEIDNITIHKPTHHTTSPLTPTALLPSLPAFYQRTTLPWNTKGETQTQTQLMRGLQGGRTSPPEEIIFISLLTYNYFPLYHNTTSNTNTNDWL